MVLMKKTTKKLTLHRTTIANLTAPALEHIFGGANAPLTPECPIAVHSVKITTKVEPCQ
jgi:hypothetical protein